MAHRLIEEALENIVRFGEEADPLRQLARYIVARRH
jgi:geranylgeranyl pyrophosphate synthase